MKFSGKITIPTSISVSLCDVALLLYFCVMFAHQQETMLGRLLRYGSLFFVIGSTVFTYPITFHPKRGLFWRVGSFELWMIVLFLYSLLSLAWCMDVSVAGNVLLNLAKVLLVCLCLAPHLDSEERVERVLWILLFALAYMLVMLMLRTPLSAWGTERIGSELGQHSNEIGRLAGLGSLLAFYFYTKKRHCGLMLLLVAAFGMTALLTGSKNALLILIFQLGLYIFLISGNWKKLIAVLAAIAAAAVLFWLIMNNAMLYQLVGIRVERMLALFFGGDVDGSTTERLYFMRTAWQLFLWHPVKGVGLDNFSAYLASIGYHNAVYSHCGFLELLSTLGIIGFMLYYVMYGTVLKGLAGPAFRHHKLAAVCFAFTLRIFLFDISTISLYTYNSYITLLLAYSCMNCMRAAVQQPLEPAEYSQKTSNPEKEIQYYG
ncbi:MAG: O-antigen ligase family protein [Butyricicoccus sp.]